MLDRKTVCLTEDKDAPWQVLAEHALVQVYGAARLMSENEGALQRQEKGVGGSVDTGKFFY